MESKSYLLLGRVFSATALYAVTFRPNTDGRIVAVQLRWEDPDIHKVTEINGNFNTWDLAANFEEASPHYQLAVIVAQYAEVFRHNPWAAGTSASQLVEQAYRISSLLWDDTEVAEFAHPRVPGAWSVGPASSERWGSIGRLKKFSTTRPRFYVEDGLWV
jgi:hypothetical protein